MMKLIVAVVILLVICSYAEGKEPSQSRAVKATSTAMGVVKKATNKGARVVEKTADGVTVRVERFVNPDPHQPGASNLLVSAGRGAGRLARNFTLETSRAIGAVGGSAIKLVRTTSGATIESVKQAASRIANPRRRSKAQSSEISNGGDSSSDDNEATNEAGAQNADELARQDNSSD